MSYPDLFALNAATHPEFMAQISGTVSAVRGLVGTQLGRQQERMGSVAVQSPGAKEDRALSDQSEVIAHSPSEARDRTALLLLASGHHIEGMCRLYESVNAILYAPDVLARCAVEAASRAAWLADPSITPMQRVERILTERLHDLYGPDAGMSDEAKTIRRSQRKKIREGVRDVGLTVAKTKWGDRYVGEPRPSAAMVMAKLLPPLKKDPDGEALEAVDDEDRRGLGRLVQETFSQVVHSSATGLVMPLDRDHLQQAGLRHYTGMLGHGSAEVVLMLHLVAVAFVKATDQYRLLVGWRDDDWHQARQQFVDQWRLVEDALGPA